MLIHVKVGFVAFSASVGDAIQLGLFAVAPPKSVVLVLGLFGISFCALGFATCELLGALLLAHNSYGQTQDYP
ncbi:hypothetical protein LJ737_00695 [Hymenobacter sp. 15J16-1T3B]|uniref:hypothetical protein n=1 Tax=Hymenobacter sp. 15J16-1T3B TaxID=2886941 RepID=UPI001D1044F9|nr:hypothetical protein [Hymenobacter sp. 15J16-1T3B]MCC3155735.1 hypothetical protein [Hymenobacter sp. 15J16-1T3B]